MSAPGWRELTPPPLVGGMSTDDFCDLVLAYPPSIARDWLVRRGWLAIPIHDYLDGPVIDAWGHLLPFLRDQSKGGLRLIAFVPRGDDPRVAVYEVSPTPEALLDLANDLPGNDWFLTDESLSFLLFRAEIDHYVIAGPREFVEAAAGCSVDEALRRFDKALESRGKTYLRWCWDRIGRHYRRVADAVLGRNGAG